jgi:hypothetical protein
VLAFHPRTSAHARTRIRVYATMCYACTLQCVYICAHASVQKFTRTHTHSHTHTRRTQYRNTMPLVCGLNYTTSMRPSDKILRTQHPHCNAKQLHLPRASWAQLNLLALLLPNSCTAHAWRHSIYSIYLLYLYKTGAPPKCRRGHSAVVTASAMYVFGGWDGGRNFSDLHKLSLSRAWLSEGGGGCPKGCLTKLFTKPLSTNSTSNPLTKPLTKPLTNSA